MDKVEYKCNEIQCRYEIGMQSIIGERSEQQDCIYARGDIEECLLILCDGMGGFEGGSLASRKAVDELTKIYDREQGIKDADFLTYAMDVADHAVSNIQNKENESIRAGTTCVMVVINKNEVHWMSVGDSRLYIIRDKRITQMTRDHTVELKARIEYANGKLTWQEFEDTLNERNALCSYLGINGIEIYDVSRQALKLKTNDILLLISDGIYKSLKDDEILQCVLHSKNMQNAALRLVEEATKIARGHNQDNTSVIICRIK